MKKKSLLLTAVATLGLTAATMAQTVPSYVPTNGIAGWWPFNGNANDESGNNNHGIVNGATLSTDRFGQTNKAYNFNGLTSYIEVPNASNLQLTNNYSISGWFNANVFFLSSTNDRRLISKVQPGGWYGGYEIFIGGNTNDIAHTGNVGGNNFVVGSSGYNINNWYMFTVTYEGTTQNLYMNGVLVNSQPNTGSLQTSTLPLLFGKIGGNSGYFDGELDDIGIWNRALTQQEITDLYNGCQLSINTQPTSQQININNNAQFIVGSSDPSATFQWQTDLGVGFQNLNSVGQYSGTTNDTLTVANVSLSNNNQPFRCIISSGSCSDTSNVAVLTVNNNVGINEFAQGNLFSFYPNPAQTVINVKADSKLVGEQYTIIDNSGRIVLSGKIVTEYTSIELGSLSNGVYLFNVGNNLKQQFKILKH
jgi:hypothetical protein